MAEAGASGKSLGRSAFAGDGADLTLALPDHDGDGAGVIGQHAAGAAERGLVIGKLNDLEGRRGAIRTTGIEGKEQPIRPPHQL